MDSSTNHQNITVVEILRTKAVLQSTLNTHYGEAGYQTIAQATKATMFSAISASFYEAEKKTLDKLYLGSTLYEKGTDLSRYLPGLKLIHVKLVKS